ncbi:unnamed protein product [Arctogadus glacialis]
MLRTRLVSGPNGLSAGGAASAFMLGSSLLEIIPHPKNPSPTPHPPPLTPSTASHAPPALPRTGVPTSAPAPRARAGRRGAVALCRCRRTGRGGAAGHRSVEEPRYVLLRSGPAAAATVESRRVRICPGSRRGILVPSWC